MLRTRRRKASRKPVFNQKAPRLTPCPPHLEKFLDLINLLPPDAELPPLKRSQESNSVRQSQDPWFFAHKTGIELQARFMELCRVISTLRSEPFGEYIFGSKKLLRTWAPFSERLEKRSEVIRGDQMYEAIARYNDFRFQRVFLKSTMNLESSRRAGEESMHVEGRLYGSWYITKDGRFEVTLAPFIKALWNDDVSIAQLGICANKNCGRVFWLGRKDQKCCPVPSGKLSGCSHAYRNQEYRSEKKRLDAKLRRISNAEYKEKLAARTALRQNKTHGQKRKR